MALKSHFDQAAASSFLEDGFLFPLEVPGSSAEDLFLVAWDLGDPSNQPCPDRPSLYAPRFELDLSPSSRDWFRAGQWARVSRDELIDSLKRTPKSPGLPDSEWQAASVERFAADFQALQSELRSGRLRKAVLAVFEERQAAFGPEERREALLRLLETTRGVRRLRLYGLFRKSEAMLGATPEILGSIRLSDGEFRTMALAGTRPHGSDPRARLSLLDDPKELEEHRLVIEGIRASLDSMIPSRLEIGETGVLELPTLSHLMTPISATLPASALPTGWIECLHPTPALGAWPRAEGARFLRERGSDERGRFGAPFFLLDPASRTQFQPALVAIRCLQWQEGLQRVGAGCGVIAQSALEREWDELEQKLASIRAWVRPPTSPAEGHA